MHVFSDKVSIVQSIVVRLLFERKAGTPEDFSGVFLIRHPAHIRHARREQRLFEFLPVSETSRRKIAEKLMVFRTTFSLPMRFARTRRG
jgi:hypothetical protein